MTDTKRTSQSGTPISCRENDTGILVRDGNGVIVPLGHNTTGLRDDARMKALDAVEAMFKYNSGDDVDAHVMAIKAAMLMDFHYNTLRSCLTQSVPSPIVGGDVKEALEGAIVRLELLVIRTTEANSDDRISYLNDTLELRRALTHAPALDAVKVPEEIRNGLEAAKQFIGNTIYIRGYGDVPYSKVIIALKELDDLESMLSAAPATSPDDGWMPIDTNKFVSAKRFLVLNEDQNIPYIAWRNTEDNWCSRGRDRERPTHWKELSGLPPAPSDKRGG